MVDADINGLICIDLWDEIMGQPMAEPYLTWVHRLSQDLEHHDWHSVINACYQCQINYHDPSMYNTLLAYNWSRFDQDIMLEFIANTGHSRMSQSMQRWFGNNAFALYSTHSLCKHQRYLVPHVKKWLVVGASWQSCVHDRPLGLKNLVREFQPLGHEFYGVTWGFTRDDLEICTAQDFMLDSTISWKQINDQLFLAQGLKG